MSEPGLTPTEQAPASTAATVDVDGGTVTDLWRGLLEHEAFRDTVVRAFREFADGRTVPELYDALAERDVPVAPDVPGGIRDLARGKKDTAWWLAVLPGLGRDVGTVEDLHAVAGLVDALEETPTIAVRLGAPFRERRRDQREHILALLATLARGLDVRLEVSGVTRGFLLSKHREDPGVCEWCRDHRHTSPSEARVDEALATLDPDGHPVGILRRLADQPSGTLTYADLYEDEALPSESRVRAVVGELADLDLVERFGSETARTVGLLPTGERVLDAIDADAGRQATLAETEPRVCETPKSVQRPCNPGEHGREEGVAGDATAPYTTAYADTPVHAAAAGVAETGAVTLVEDRIGGSSDGPDRTRYVSYDPERDEAYIAVRATTVVQYAVSTALAFTDPQFLARALPEARLETLEEGGATLRDVRCVGWLPDEALSDPGKFLEELDDARSLLVEMTREWARGDVEDAGAFRSEMTSFAHGLAGSVVHLLDALGTDVYREVRVPGNVGEKDLGELATSIGYGTAIQSQYGAYAAYRQLFEDREDKRRSASSPEIDAEAPTGSLIGGLIVRGPSLHRLRPHLERALSHPAETHEDAPEFAVEVPLRDVDREAFAAVVSRMLQGTGLRPTREAVDVLRAQTASPYAVAWGLHHLADDNGGRDIRPDEVRYALAALEPVDLLPDLPPTLGKVLTALLRTDRRLSQTDLAEAAGVSPESIRTHREALEGLGLLDVDDDGYRLALSFRTAEERHRGGWVLPVPVAADVSFTEVVSDVAEAVLTPEEYADPRGGVYEALSWPPDPWDLVEDARLEPWVRLAARLVGADPPTGDRTVRMGPSIEQTPLADPTAVPAD